MCLVMANVSTDEALALTSDLASFIEVYEENSKTKIKWHSDRHALKCFLEENLKLTVIWSFVLSNGGYHLFKSSVVSISFYPKTKTVYIQGAKSEIIKKRFVDLAAYQPLHPLHGEPTIVSTDCETRSQISPIQEQPEDFPNDNEDIPDNNEDIPDNEGIPDNNEGGTEEIFSSSSDEESGSDEEVDEHNNNNPGGHCNCNCRAIIERLTAKLSSLEEKFVNFHSANSYHNNELLSKISTLEEEKNSLVVALRVLATSQSSTSISKRNSESEGSSEKTTRKSKKTKHQEKTNESETPAPNDFRQQQKRNTKEPESKPFVVILGDSITKYVEGDKLSRKHKVKSTSFSGAVIEDMNDYVKPLLRRNPKNVILHVGTNNLQSDRPKSIKSKFNKVIQTIREEKPGVRIAISALTTRTDDTNLTSKVNSVNNTLEQYCNANNIDFINNNNITSSHLNTGGLHLTRQGTLNLASNFRKYLYNLA